MLQRKGAGSTSDKPQDAKVLKKAHLFIYFIFLGSSKISAFSFLKFILFLFINQLALKL